MSTISRVAKTAKSAAKSAKKAKKIDMSNAARMKRAKEQGFDVDKVWYHGGSSAPESFDKQPRRGMIGPVYLTDNPDTASSYAILGGVDPEISTIDDMIDEATFFNPKVYAERPASIMPLFSASRKPLDVELDITDDVVDAFGVDRLRKIIDPEDEIFDSPSAKDISDYINENYSWDDIAQVLYEDAESLQNSKQGFNFLHVAGLIDEYLDKRGYDAVLIPEDLENIGSTLIPRNPELLRSVSAAFDPEDVKSSNLLAQYAPLAVGAGAAGLALSPEESMAAGMNVYEVEDPVTGMVLELEGDSPPTEQELEEIFAQYAPTTVEESRLESDVPLPPEDVEQLTPEQQKQYFGTVDPQEFTAKEWGLGGLQALGTIATGATTGMAGQFVGGTAQAAKDIASGEFGSYEAAQRVGQAGERGAESMTYIPSSPAGIEVLETVGDVLGPIGAAAGALSPMASSGLGTMARAARPQARMALPQVEQAVSQANQKIKQSIAKRSARYGEGTSAGAAATPEALQRVQTAESLPVPVKLTKGAALRNADELAFEKEQMKSALGGPLRDRIEENNLQILQNFDEMIDRTGATDVYAGKEAVGRSVSRAFRQGYEDAKNKVRAAYDAANRSKESQLPVNSDEFVSYINQQVTGSPSVAVVDYLRKYIKKNEIGTVDDTGKIVISKPLTMKAMEDLRKEINQNVTNERADIGQATRMKALIDSAQNEAAGPLYKKARALRTQQAEIFENRAYISRLVENIKNTQDPQVPYDKVFDKTILNASPQEIRTIRRVLNAHGEAGKKAWNELQASTVDYIRERATNVVGTDSGGNPIVSTAKLNQVITKLDSNGRLDEVFGKQQAQVIRDLNDVVKYVNTVPPGTLVNSSGTAAMLVALMGESAVTGVATGVPVPVMVTLKILRDAAKDRKIKRKVQNALDYANKLNEGGQ